MKILLDTHVFIWLDSAPENLSQTALNICQNQNNQLYLSIASVWEMQIKYQLGKLNLRLPIAQMLATQQHNSIKLRNKNGKMLLFPSFQEGIKGWWSNSFISYKTID